MGGCRPFFRVVRDRFTLLRARGFGGRFRAQRASVDGDESATAPRGEYQEQSVPARLRLHLRCAPITVRSRDRRRSIARIVEDCGSYVGGAEGCYASLRTCSAVTRRRESHRACARRRGACPRKSAVQGRFWSGIRRFTRRVTRAYTLGRGARTKRRARVCRQPRTLARRGMDVGLGGPVRVAHRMWCR